MMLDSIGSGVFRVDWRDRKAVNHVEPGWAVEAELVARNVRWGDSFRKGHAIQLAKGGGSSLRPVLVENGCDPATCNY